MTTKVAGVDDREMFKQLVRLAYQEPETREMLVPYLQREACRYPEGKWVSRIAEGPLPDQTFEELYKKRQQKIQEEEDAAAKDKPKPKSESKTKDTGKKDTAKEEVTEDSLTSGLSDQMSKDLSSAFTYKPNRNDFLDFLGEAGHQILVPTYGLVESARNPITEMLGDIFTLWTSDDYSPAQEELTKGLDVVTNYMNEVTYSFGFEVLKNVVWDVPTMALKTFKAAFTAPVKLIKGIASSSPGMEDWLIDKGVISGKMEITPEFTDKVRASLVTLSEYANKHQNDLYGDESSKATVWDKIKKTLLTFPANIPIIGTITGLKKKYNKLITKIDRTRKQDWTKGILERHFEKYTDAKAPLMRRKVRDDTKAYLKENKKELSDLLKESLIAVAEGKDLDADIGKGINPSDEGIGDAIKASIRKYALSQKDKITDKEAFIKKVKDQDFSSDVEKMSTSVSKSIKPKIKTKMEEVFTGKNGGANQGTFTKELDKLAQGGEKYREVNSAKGIRGPFRPFFKALREVRSWMGLGAPEKPKNLGTGKDKGQGKGKGKGDKFEDFVAKRNDAGGFFKKETGNHVNFQSLSVEDQKKVKKQWESGKFHKNKNKKASSEPMSLLKHTIRVAHEHKELRDVIFPILKESKDTGLLFSKLVRLANDNEAFRPHLIRMVKAKNLPPDVERYVEEGKEQGMPEEKAWAVAWSRFCQYKNPGSPHCKQKSYFPGRKASQQVIQTILNQLGGGWGKIKMMTGAKNLLDQGNGMSFQFSGGRKANYVKIMLDAGDTYSMEIGNIRGVNYKVLFSESGLYAEDLKPAFERVTGLTLSVPKVRLASDGHNASEESVEFLDSLSTEVNNHLFDKVSKKDYPWNRKKAQWISEGIKLAHENPHLRPKLLPLLKKLACGDEGCTCGGTCSCGNREA